MLPVHGRPLWQHQLEVLRATNPVHTYLSVGRGKHHPFPGVECVEDRVADAGPLAGIEAVLARQSSPFLLVLAVDLPLMTASFLQSLLEACRPGRGCVPELDGRTEPLAAVYPREALDVAVGCLADGVRAARELVARCEARGLVERVRVTGEDALLFRNVNCPSDWPPDA
jgi:molybdopterin-guanine dinucleotide biosynthesis protein A